MGIRAFFHKIKLIFVRAKEPSIPHVSAAKRYGNFGENNFIYMLRRELPSCKIKKNVVISTSEGNGEIDCLVLNNNKLFAIEVKSWKGVLTEKNGYFLKETTDRWTNETHTKLLKSPFKQLGRAIHLLKNQIPIKVWVNSVVFFNDADFESVTTFSDNVWFDHFEDLINYILNYGKDSLGKNAKDFFEKCIPADCLYANEWGKSKHCIINRNALKSEILQGNIDVDKIVSIRIYHHLSYDELYITMTDGSIKAINSENAKIRVSDNGITSTHALCKLDYIELGRTIVSE